MGLIKGMNGGHDIRLGPIVLYPKCWVCGLFFPQLVTCVERSQGGAAHPVRGFQGGISPPTQGLGKRLRKIIFDPIRLVNLPMVLCMGFAHVFGHDDFFPMVFC